MRRNKSRRDVSRFMMHITSTPHAKSFDIVLDALQGSLHGLTRPEAAARLEVYGPNQLPRPPPPGLLKVFLRQFASPLIYVLLAAAVLSLLIQYWSDAGFIFAVLLVNAIIGTVQEFSAQRAAPALGDLVATLCHVLHGGDSYEIDASGLVPGDIVLLEAGDRVPADLRLLGVHDLELDESLLTGESLPVLKDAAPVLETDTVLAERRNMAFAGTLVARGRGRAVVVATGLVTELGHIAADVLGQALGQAPLVVRMERFTRLVAIVVGVAASIMALVALWQGMAYSEVFLLAV